MDIKATIDKESFGYRNRLLLIALGAMLYAAWCLYDALIAYPDQIDAYDAITQLKDDYPEDWRDRWEDEAKANDWDPTREPDERTEGDILTQWLQFAIVFPIGSYCLFSVATWSRRYVGVDDEKLYANGGVEVPSIRSPASTRASGNAKASLGSTTTPATASEISSSMTSNSNVSPPTKSSIM